eukprot:UN29519
MNSGDDNGRRIFECKKDHGMFAKESEVRKIEPEEIFQKLSQTLKSYMKIKRKNEIIEVNLEQIKEENKHLENHNKEMLAKNKDLTSKLKTLARRIIDIEEKHQADVLAEKKRMIKAEKLKFKVSHEPFEKRYDLQTLMGKGTWTAVYNCIRKDDNAEFCVRICREYNIDKNYYSKKKKRAAEDSGEQQSIEYLDVFKLIKNDKDMLSNMEHPNIVKIFESCEVGDMYLVKELCYGGTLLDRMDEDFTEGDISDILSQLSHVIAYLDKKRIVHRDLTVNSIYYTSRKRNAPIKIVNFDHAIYCGSEQLIHPGGGDPQYFSPEMLLEEGYDCRSDLWSIGIILYVLLVGCLPFANDEFDAD